MLAGEELLILNTVELSLTYKLLTNKISTIKQIRMLIKIYFSINNSNGKQSLSFIGTAD